MDFSINQAKDIFDLIISVNNYSLPLLLSLLIPFLWTIYCKLLPFDIVIDDKTEINKSWYYRIRNSLIKHFKLTHTQTNKSVFYFCISLFIFGIIYLKFGEYKEEIIRQNAISLKHLYEVNGYLYYHIEGLKRTGYDEKEVEDITYNYPEIFIKSGKNIVCVDSTIQNNIYKVNHSLLELYLKNKLKHIDFIRMDDLYQSDFYFDTKQNKNVEIRNVKNFFSKDIVYSFLVSPLNNGKYALDVRNNEDCIIKLNKV